MPRIVGQRALGGQVVADRAVELVAQPAGVVGARERQGAVAGPVVGNHLVARGVVGLDEDDVPGAAEAGTMPGSRAGRPGEDRDRRQRGGGQDGRRADTPGILHALSSTTLGLPSVDSAPRRSRIADASQRAAATPTLWQGYAPETKLLRVRQNPARQSP